MQMTRRRLRLVSFPLCVAAALAIAPLPPVASVAAQAVAARAIPARLDDATFWRMVNDFSEPGGYFRSDNFVSNETTFQHVIPELNRTLQPGGVYMGVGPDQNYTYIVALQPKIAFIVDIRRQNMLQHLMYKSLFEMSEDRAGFLSLLFSRPRPKAIDPRAIPEALFLAYDSIAPDSVMFRRTFAAMKRLLVERHGFALVEDDLRGLEYVFTAFYAGGPDLTYSFASPGRGSFFGDRRMPTYAELMVENDGREAQRSYLASEANYRVLRELHRNNLIVPLTGDFGGDKAIRAVGRYLRERNAPVSAFYLSNVEQYLFQQNDAWRKFFDNVATLPTDTSSTFIRAVFNNMGYYRPPAPTPTQRPGPRSVTLLASIVEQLKAYTEGRVLTYFDVVQLSREPVPQP